MARKTTAKETEKAMMPAGETMEEMMAMDSAAAASAEAEAAAGEADAATPIVGEDDVETEGDMEIPAAVVPEVDEAAPAEAPRPRARRRRVQTSTNRIIEGDSDVALTALTPEQAREQNWLHLKQAMERRTIMERRIIGVEPAGDGRSTPRVYVLVDEFRVAISTRDFFDANLFSGDLSKVSDEERNRREFQMASRMMGAFIPFVITDAQSRMVDGERVYAVRASRKEAMQRKRHNYFFGPTPRIREGDKVKARVLMSTSKSILMEVVGQEVMVPVHELSSCKWIDPLFDFPAGTVTYVSVVSLDIDKKNQTVDMVVSCRPMDADDARRNFAAVHEGMRYTGKVVSVDEKYVRINLDCHVRASAPIISLNGARLHYGDRVSVGITGKNEQTMSCYGTCLPLQTRSY